MRHRSWRAASASRASRAREHRRGFRDDIVGSRRDWTQHWLRIIPRRAAAGIGASPYSPARANGGAASRQRRARCGTPSRWRRPTRWSRAASPCVGAISRLVASTLDLARPVAPSRLVSLDRPLAHAPPRVHLSQATARDVFAPVYIVLLLVILKLLVGEESLPPLPELPPGRADCAPACDVPAGWGCRAARPRAPRRAPPSAAP